MCRIGTYTERGIKDRHGYGSERYRIDGAFAVRIDPALGDLGVLLEPTSVVAKAWDHIERIGGRSPAWSPRTVLVCGAGPRTLTARAVGVNDTVRQRSPHQGTQREGALRPLSRRYAWQTCACHLDVRGVCLPGARRQPGVTVGRGEVPGQRFDVHVIEGDQSSDFDVGRCR